MPSQMCVLFVAWVGRGAHKGMATRRSRALGGPRGITAARGAEGVPDSSRGPLRRAAAPRQERMTGHGPVACARFRAWVEGCLGGTQQVQRLDERRSAGRGRAEPLPGRAGRVPGTLGAVPPALGVPWRAAHLTALPVWWEVDADQVISATRHLKRTRSAPRESLPRDPAGAQERPPQAKRARSGNSQHNAGTGHRAPGWKPCRGLAASAVALLEASRSFSGSRHLPDESHTCSSVEECL